MSIQRPIVNLGQKYIFNLRTQYLSSTVISVRSGKARDSADIMDIDFTSAGLADISVEGNRGLDTGVVANNSLYAVHIIGDSTRHNPASIIFSLNFSTPKLPEGYDAFRRVGAIRTDGSSDIREFCQLGTGHDRYTYYLTPINVLTGGVSTSFADIDLTGVVPGVNPLMTIVDTVFTPTAATDVVHLRGFTATAGSTGAVNFGTGVLAPQTHNNLVQAELSGNTPIVQYFVDNGSLDLNISGFIDLL